MRGSSDTGGVAFAMIWGNGLQTNTIVIGARRRDTT